MAQQESPSLVSTHFVQFVGNPVCVLVGLGALEVVVGALEVMTGALGVVPATRMQ